MARQVEVPSLPNPEPVRLESRQTAVIVVDMQNDFVHENGRLRVPTARETVEKIKRLLSKAREKGVRVVYTQDWHSKNDPEFAIWGEHAVRDTWGAEIVEEIRPDPDDIIIRKVRYDAFYGTDLDHHLRLIGSRNVVVCGTVANICVLHTAGSAALRWLNVVIPIDCISALSEFDYYATLRQVDFLYKGKITRSDLIEFV